MKSLARFVSLMDESTAPPGIQFQPDVELQTTTGFIFGAIDFHAT